MDDDCGGVIVNNENIILIRTNFMTIVNADDYAVSGVVNMADVFTANPTGNLQIRLNDGDYRSNNIFTRDNVSIVGLQKPELSDDTNSLVGGSIIKGMFWLTGNGISVRDFGVDAGLNVCNNLFSGTAKEAFGLIGDTGGSAIQKRDVEAHNISALAKDSTSAVHAFIAQGISRFDASNIDGIGGYHAVVFKVTKGNVRGIKGRKGGVSGIYIKSDTYPNGEDCNTNNFSDLIVCDTAITNPTYGVIVHADTKSAYDINISNVNVIGAQTGFALVGDLRSSWVNTLRKITATNINIYQSTVLGFNCYGGIGESVVSNMNIYAPTTDRALEIQADCLGLRLRNVLASLRSGSSSSKADCISLAGRVFADGVHCIEDGDYTKKRGIKDNIEVISGVKYGSLTNTWGNVT